MSMPQPCGAPCYSASVFRLMLELDLMVWCCIMMILAALNPTDRALDGMHAKAKACARVQALGRQADNFVALGDFVGAQRVRGYQLVSLDEKLSLC
jgi:hypothetical protein|eukprot:SAG25_NODE_402_length_8471_cov_23.612757_12_plen_96_part_00